jgi:hypothetical protein
MDLIFVDEANLVQNLQDCNLGDFTPLFEVKEPGENTIT